MAKTNLEKQNDFNARQTNKGLVRIPLWVPECKKEELRAISKTMCKQFEHTNQKK
tara:strand:- start:9378 stop:9542 length:165 start_codon:yes stop_codon:yes gene_type:complete